jgi:hypothetical protein
MGIIPGIQSDSIERREACPKNRCTFRGQPRRQIFFLCCLADCAVPPASTPAQLPVDSAAIATPATSTTAQPTSTRSSTLTSAATQKWPLTLVFFRDSFFVKVREVGRDAKYGLSFVDNLRERLDTGYNLITANYGGRNAKWTFENIRSTGLSFLPDFVTLWWGFNDLLGCGGFFDRKINKGIPENLDNLVERHI